MRSLFSALSNSVARNGVVAFPQAILPACLPAVTDWLRSAGAHQATLFGSALYTANLGIPERASDCDLQIASHDIRWWALQERLIKHAAHFEFSDSHPIRPPRLIFYLHSGTTVDASIGYRCRSPEYLAAHSLFGITALATDVFSKKTYARPEFFTDRASQVIRPLVTNDDMMALSKYEDKLTLKLPHFKVQSVRSAVASCR
jgi:hypothetical protein